MKKGTVDDKAVKSSKQGIFQAAFVGALLPRLVSTFDDKGLHLPGATFADNVGWLILALLLALAAGWVAANVWKERDARQA